MTIIVVGGGIAGLYSSILASKHGDRVVLIEQAPALGGLLNSIRSEEGDYFDYGTHLISGTGIKEVDEIILNPAWLEDWLTLPRDNSGNFFGGKMEQDCAFPNIGNLGSELHDRCLAEIVGLAEVGYQESYRNLLEKYLSQYGETTASQALRPVFGKLFGTEQLEELDANANKLFGLNRIVVSTREETKRLKENPLLDQVLSFHKREDGPSARMQYYPKVGGVEDWARKLEAEARSRGVEMLTGHTIKSFATGGGKILSADLGDGKVIELDSLVWTIPPHFLLMALGMKLELKRVKIRQIHLFNYVIDKAPLTGNYFFYCYDPEYLPFRVTLYSNIQEGTRHRITAEVLCGPGDDTTAYRDVIAEQLRAMGIVSGESQYLYKEHVPIRGGFPVIDTDYRPTMHMVRREAFGRYSNIMLVGKSSGESWFMNEVLSEVYTEGERFFER